VVPVIAIFVDALDHIPKHRSLKLFVKLLTTLGSSEYLFVFVSLLLKRIVLADKATEAVDIEEDDNPLVFCRTLCGQFPATDQLRCMRALLDNFCALTVEDNSAANKKGAASGKKRATGGAGGASGAAGAMMPLAAAAAARELTELQRLLVAPDEHTPKQVSRCMVDAVLDRLVGNGGGRVELLVAVVVVVALAFVFWCIHSLSYILRCFVCCFVCFFATGPSLRVPRAVVC
jgi:hypothetical protein